jgi:hypothetical protein
MRKISCRVSLFSISLLLSSIAVAKEAPSSEVLVSLDAPSACDAVGGNIVLNCGFETGAFDDWNRSGDLSFSDVTHGCAGTGDWGAEMGPASDLGFLTQTLPTTKGETYTLSFWLSNQGAPNRFEASWDGEVIMGVTNYPTASWTLVSIPVVGSSNPDGTELQFGFYNSGGYFCLDDVVVEIK